MKEALRFKPTFLSAVLLFSVLLLVGDAAFVALHILNHFFLPAGKSSFFYLGHDRGVAEFYQYIKYIWVVLLLTLLAYRSRQYSFLFWCPVFIYLLIDDAVGVHESVGAAIAHRLEMEPLFGLRLQDYGELLVSAGAGFIVLTPVVLAMIKGTPQFRKASLDFICLIGLLAFFGVFVDMLHIALPVERVGKFVLGIIEDGGEMISGSLLVAYALFRLAFNQNHYLVESLWCWLFKSNSSSAAI